MLTLDRVLISRESIAERVAEMGARIAADLEAEAMTDAASARTAPPGAGRASPVVLVPVLTGALIFVADLVRHMPVPLTIKPVTLSSYPGTATVSQGVSVQSGSGVPTDLQGCRVLVVDDILDSGQTLGLLRRLIAAQRPRSVRLAVLLDKHKPAGRTEEVAVDYAGFRIADEFVVGYGLDYDGLYRNLPDIRTLRQG